MIRFKKFVLQEKVSKAEHNAALSDSNVTIGVEFEYIDHSIREGVKNNQDNDSIVSDYFQLTRKVELAVSIRRKDENEFDNEMKQEYKNEVEKKKESLMNLKVKLKK